MSQNNKTNENPFKLIVTSTSDVRNIFGDVSNTSTIQSASNITQTLFTGSTSSSTTINIPQVDNNQPGLSTIISSQTCASIPVTSKQSITSEQLNIPNYFSCSSTDNDSNKFIITCNSVYSAGSIPKNTYTTAVSSTSDKLPMTTLFGTSMTMPIVGTVSSSDVFKCSTTYTPMSMSSFSDAAVISSAPASSIFSSISSFSNITSPNIYQGTYNTPTFSTATSTFMKVESNSNTTMSNTRPTMSAISMFQTPVGQQGSSVFGSVINQPPNYFDVIASCSSTVSTTNSSAKTTNVLVTTPTFGTSPIFGGFSSMGQNQSLTESNKTAGNTTTTSQSSFGTSEEKLFSTSQVFASHNNPSSDKSKSEYKQFLDLKYTTPKEKLFSTTSLFGGHTSQSIGKDLFSSKTEQSSNVENSKSDNTKLLNPFAMEFTSGKPIHEISCNQPSSNIKRRLGLRRANSPKSVTTTIIGDKSTESANPPTIIEDKSTDSANPPTIIEDKSTESANPPTIIEDKSTESANPPTITVADTNLASSVLAKAADVTINPSSSSVIQDLLKESIESQCLGTEETEKPKPPESPDKVKPHTIIAINIPSNCLDKTIIRNHFNKFGKVTRVIINQKANQASIHFVDHESAANAKHKGKNIHPKLPDMHLLFTTTIRNRRTSDDTGQVVSSQKKKEAMRTLRQASREGNCKDTSYISKYKVKADKYSIKQRIKDTNKNNSGKYCNVSNATKPKNQSDVHTPKKYKEGVPSNKGKTDFSKYYNSSLDTFIKSDQMSPMTISTSSESSQDPKISLSKQASNLTDKYEILRARDKLLRMKQKRIYDVSKAQYLAATCPDMCPEKERYMRSDQNDLSSFETINGEVDHRFVVKKFSRSSADKDEPLPHELRPASVLVQTMDFLVCNVIEKWSDPKVEIDIWYNYLWNRTRALRNDITQQYLVDENAVFVLERCIRFHIHCGERLCEEPPDQFDLKMNSEHLIKSMQTLKELYHDLAEKGQHFESEAEFRSYELLENVNDGNIMFKYIRLPDNIRNSDFIKLAVAVLHAIQTNNFAKFFKLITNATYLQACIMHRYFNMVRGKALAILMKAYGASKPQSIPSDYIISLLGFDGASDASVYFSHHKVQFQGGNIVMDRKKFTLITEEKPPLCRSKRLIESKVTGSVGEIIQGGVLPPNPLHYHVPHDSFSTDGYLNKDAIDASDQNVAKESEEDLLEISTLPANEEDMAVEKLDTDLVDNSEFEFVETTDIDLDKNNGFSRSISSDFTIHNCSKTVDDQSVPPSSALTPLTSDQIVESVLEDVNSVMLGPQLCIDIIHEVVTEQIKLLFRSVVEDVSVEYASIMKADHFYAERLRRKYFCCFKDYVLLKKKSKKSFREAKLYIRRELFNNWKIKASRIHRFDDIKSNMKYKLLFRYFNTWQTNTLKAKIFRSKINMLEKKARIRHFIKIWKNSVIQRKLMDRALIHAHSQVAIETITLWINQAAIKINNERSNVHYQSILLKGYFNKWKTWLVQKKKQRQFELEAFPACGSQLSISEQNVFWVWGYNRQNCENKSVLEMSQLDEQINLLCKKYNVLGQLEHHISWGPLPLIKVLKDKVNTSGADASKNLLNCYFKIVIDTSQMTNLHFKHWIRKKFDIENSATDLMQPLSSVIKIKSDHSGHEFGIIITEVTEQHDPLLPNTKLKGTSGIILLMDSKSDFTHAKHYESNYAHIPLIVIKNSVEEQSNINSNDNIWNLTEDMLQCVETSKKLLDFTLDMWTKRGTYICLNSSSLHNLVTKFVYNNVMEKIYTVQGSRMQFGYSPLHPNVYIKFYNDSLRFLIHAIQDHKIKTLDWPPPEINDMEPMSSMKPDLPFAVQSLVICKLPLITIENSTWNELRNYLVGFLEQVTSKEANGYELSSEVVKMFEMTRKNFLTHYQNCDSNDEYHILLLPWIDIINACVSYKLSFISNSKLYYQPSSLISYKVPELWTDACKTTDNSFYIVPQSTIKEKQQQSPSKRKADQTLDNSAKQKTRKIHSTFLDELAQEKSKNAKFEKYLQDEYYLIEDELNNLFQ